jgi:hypothetical protein
LLVEGAPPFICPKRRCQMADGVAESRRHHWLLTLLSNVTLDVESGLSKLDQEALSEKFPSVVGYSSCEGVQDAEPLEEFG